MFCFGGQVSFLLLSLPGTVLVYFLSLIRRARTDQTGQVS